MQMFTVLYQAGTYSGTRKVPADDGDQAIAKVRAWVRRQMIKPLYADYYEVIHAGASIIEDTER